MSTRPTSLARTAGSWLSWLNVVWLALAIIGGGCIVFLPSLHGGWVWDDYLYIVQNPALRSVGGLSSLWLTPPGVNYFPVTFTVQWVQWHLWGDSTTGYHLTNLGLHLLNCFLVWRILSRLGVRLAWLAGLLFAVHPLTVESVAWISELKNVLSLAFVLAALDAYLDFDDKPQPLSYVRAWVFFVAAMLSKSTVAMFPLSLLLLIWWKRARVRSRDLWFTAPFLAVAGGLGLVTVWFEHHRAMSGAPAAAGMLARAAGAGNALGFYFLKSVIPINLQASYPSWSTDWPWLWILSPAILLVAAFALIWTGRRTAWTRHVALGGGWFLFNLLPVLGFIPMAYLRITNVADHFTYLALPGILGLVAAGCGELANFRGPIASRWALVAPVVASLALALVGRSYAQAYTSETLFWRTVLARNASSWLAHNHLGAVWLRSGRLEDARAEFEAALHDNPNYVEAHNNLGIALEGAGHLGEALEEFQRARQLRPADEEARRNLAALHVRLGINWLGQNHPDQAMQDFTESLRLDPGNFTAHNNLGIALTRLGRTTEAKSHYETALQLKSDYPEAHTNLGNLLLRAGQPTEAMEHYRAALRIAPDYAPARENLAYAERLSRAAAASQRTDHL